MSAPCVHADPRRGVVTAWTGDEAALRDLVAVAYRRRGLPVPAAAPQPALPGVR